MQVPRRLMYIREFLHTHTMGILVAIPTLSTNSDVKT